ncbi:uncharacterized protein LOC120592431 [Pteropus medius]|uniref:uncharacterized protein LOC120592431 n=1 Tax=Pteropus vampyrus TaxID=132908 RepID=UPI00196A7B43|nr:uncharacterized protein LOC120592431 [Pteropus giganteus]
MRAVWLWMPISPSHQKSMRFYGPHHPKGAATRPAIVHWVTAKYRNSVSVYGACVVNSVTMGLPACTHLDTGVVHALPFGVLWAVIEGGLLLGRLLLPQRATLRVDLFGAQLLIVPVRPRHLPFAEASVPARLLLELRPCSASKPLKARSPLGWLQPVRFPAAAPPGSGAPSQYLLGTHQLSPKAQVGSRSPKHHHGIPHAMWRPHVPSVLGWGRQPPHLGILLVTMPSVLLQIRGSEEQQTS